MLRSNVYAFCNVGAFSPLETDAADGVVFSCMMYLGERKEATRPTLYQK